MACRGGALGILPDLVFGVISPMYAEQTREVP